MHKCPLNIDRKPFEQRQLQGAVKEWIRYHLLKPDRQQHQAHTNCQVQGQDVPKRDRAHSTLGFNKEASLCSGMFKLQRNHGKPVRLFWSLRDNNRPQQRISSSTTVQPFLADVEPMLSPSCAYLADVGPCWKDVGPMLALI